MSYEDWTTVEEGELVVFTAGVYSEYSILMIARALRRIDMAERRSAYLTSHPEQRESYRFNEKQFIGEVLLDDLEPLQFRETHLEDYSCVDHGWSKLHPASSPRWEDGTWRWPWWPCEPYVRPTGPDE